MGLDIVELITATEEAFGLDIPDREAERMRTPRDVIEHLAARLPAGGDTTPLCLSQRAFYRARRACADRFGVERRELARATPLADVLPHDERARHWRALGADITTGRWPPFSARTWIGRDFGFGPTTLGELSSHLALWSPAVVKGPDAKWTRREVERAFVALLEAEVGVDMRRHTLDSRFVEDMGLD